VEDLARQANMSSRNLARHFNAVTGTTPLRWLLTQRVHRAQELLETTDDAIELIAARTGMGTAATLRRHFNRTVGVAPDTYRRTFRDEPQAVNASVRAASPATASRSRPGGTVREMAASGNGATKPT
jgi:AraC family transcriptional activator FtrA